VHESWHLYYTLMSAKFNFCAYDTQSYACHDSFMGIMYGCVTGRMSMNDSLSDCDIDSHVRAIGVALAQ